MNQRRVFYPDFLRVVATFAVIVIHISGGAQWQWANSSFEWQVFNVYNGLCRWAVPVFFMVSGMFMLDAGRHGGGVADNFWRLVRSNIPRMLFILIAWSQFYAVYGHRVLGWPAVSWYDFLFKPVGIHLWFLYFIILLYIITPFLQVQLRHLEKND
ncbi:MAG: acyltransferase family protein, partial [Ottowia sp.]|nr:acyltransferase family protein [Ottowia sp.]